MALPRILFGNLFRRWGDAGTAAIEFGLFLPILLLLLTGVVELGFSMYEAMQVNNAVEAGILYATKNGFNATSIASAVVAASVLPPQLSAVTATPAPTQFCGCPTATGVTKSSTCTSPPACGDGTTPGTYIQVNASLNHTALFATSWGLPATFTATAVVRIN